MERSDEVAVRELRQIPGVGSSVAGDLLALGIRRVEDLSGQSPDALYERLCQLQGVRVDRCMLYTFRCAIYYATAPIHQPELLRWWAWKDRELTPELLAGPS